MCQTDRCERIGRREQCFSQSFCIQCYSCQTVKTFRRVNVETNPPVIPPTDTDVSSSKFNEICQATTVTLVPITSIPLPQYLVLIIMSNCRFLFRCFVVFETPLSTRFSAFNRVSLRIVYTWIGATIINRSNGDFTTTANRACEQPTISLRFVVRQTAALSPQIRPCSKFSAILLRLYRSSSLSRNKIALCKRAFN